MESSALEREDWAQAKECMWPPESGKGKEMDSLLEFPEGIQLCLHLNFSLSDPFLTSELYSSKKINLWDF